MRILQLVHDFLPNHVAGVEVYTDHLTRSLAREHDVALLFSEMIAEAPDYSLRRGQYGKVLTYELVNNQRLSRFEETYRNPNVDLRIEEVLEEFDPDVVHIQHLLNLSVDGVDTIRRRGIPILMTLHDHWLACANGGQRFHRDLGRCDELDSARCGSCTAHMSGARLAARGFLRRRRASTSAGTLSLVQLELQRIASFARRLPASAQARRIERRWDHLRRLSSAIDLFISPSNYLREEFIRFGLPPEKVQYCDYGFATEGFSKRADLPSHARRFAFIGSLVPHKGVHVLLEAFASMPEDAQLDVVGSPDRNPRYWQSLQHIARHPGIRFVGELPPEQVAHFLQTVDCQVVPSIWQENSPLTIHEAFLSGVPIVASRMGGNSELLEAGGGLLYDADDPNDLRAQLLRLYQEPNLGRHLAGSAPAVKTMEEHVAELISIYEQLYKKANSRRARP